MKVKDLKELLVNCSDEDDVVLSIEDVDGDIEFYNPTMISTSDSKAFPTMICSDWANINSGILEDD